MTNKAPADAVQIGIKIFEARREARLTQEQVGDHIGKTAQMVAKYEKGKGSVSAETLAALALLFKVSPGFFFQDPV